MNVAQYIRELTKMADARFAHYTPALANAKSCFGQCYDDDDICGACEFLAECKIKFETRAIKPFDEAIGEVDVSGKDLESLGGVCRGGV